VWIVKGRLCLAIVALALVLPWNDAGANDRFDTVVIDAGHGGEDRGARGPGGLNEKDLVLYARADLFLSIHANSARVSSARGAEVYFVSLEATDEQAQRVAQRENEAFGMLGAAAPGGRDPLFEILSDLIATEHLMESNEFARLAEDALASRSVAPSRGVKQAPFVVLMGVQMPASLIEIGFISNADEEKQMRTAEQRERIAVALAAAVLEFGRRFDARRGVSDERSIVRRGG
jgi:N-acetylmuramoyl-L-alanine amidase